MRGGLVVLVGPFKGIKILGVIFLIANFIYESCDIKKNKQKPGNENALHDDFYKCLFVFFFDWPVKFVS